MSADTDLSSLTADEIKNKIDTDYDFAKKVTSGEIVFQDEAPAPEAPAAAPPAPAQPAAPVATPAPEKTEPEDKLFTLRRSQL